MRRVSACLMIATLLVAMVPTTVSAKPVPVINSVTVTAKDSGLCGQGKATVTVAIEFEVHGQPPTAVRYEALRTGFSSSPTQPLARKATTSSQVFQQVELGAYEWSWRVTLLNRKGDPMGSSALTHAENWNVTDACPDYNPIAVFPVPE